MNRRADNKLTDQPLRDLMAQVRGSQTQQLGNVEVAIGFDQGSLQFVGNLRLIPCDA